MAIAIRPSVETTFNHARPSARAAARTVAAHYQRPFTGALTPLAITLGFAMWGALFLLVRHYF